MIIIFFPITLYVVYAMMFLGLIGQGFIGNGINEAAFVFMSVLMLMVGAVTFSVLYKIYEKKNISLIVLTVLNGFIAFISTGYVFFDNYMSFSKNILFMLINLYSMIIIINAILCVINGRSEYGEWTVLVSLLLIIITIIFCVWFSISTKNKKINNVSIFYSPHLVCLNERSENVCAIF